MTISLGNITFDCDDPQKTAAFWAAALDREIDEGASPFFVSIGVGEPDRLPNWFFIKVPEGKTVKNRVHLDLITDDRHADIERLVALGATHVADKDEWGHSWSVLADVEGNEFCLASS